MILGIVGALALAGGIAAPLLYVPIAGTISYLFQPEGVSGASYAGAIILLVCAAIAIAGTLLNWRILLAVAGLVSLAQLAETMFQIHHAIGVAQARVSATDIAEPFATWEAALLQHSHFEWGVAVVAAGGLMVLVAAALRD